MKAEEREKDIFTKSEKWLPAMPLPDFFEAVEVKTRRDFVFL